MQANQLLTADVLDIIFDGKNKSYGAYNLRKTYDSRLLKSMAIMLSTLGLMICSYFVFAGKKGDESAIIIGPDVNLTEVAPTPVEPPPPTLPPPPAATHVQTVVFTVPLLTSEEVAPPPTVEEVNDSKIGLVKSDGDAEANIVGPQNSNVNGVSNGVVTAPHKQGNDNNGFIPIEIESQYPGGVEAWRRFLNRNLGNNYPQDAIEKNIQGTVVIQFIVDKDGKVSNVEAISGPEELRDAAITVIKKSGKWDPAIQNGTQVKSYKKQPITFKLQND